MKKVYDLFLCIHGLVLLFSQESYASLPIQSELKGSRDAGPAYAEEVPGEEWVEIKLEDLKHLEADIYGERCQVQITNPDGHYKIEFRTKQKVCLTISHADIFQPDSSENYLDHIKFYEKTDDDQQKDGAEIPVGVIKTNDLNDVILNNALGGETIELLLPNSHAIASSAAWRNWDNFHGSYTPFYNWDNWRNW